MARVDALTGSYVAGGGSGHPMPPRPGSPGVTAMRPGSPCRVSAEHSRGGDAGQDRPCAARAGRLRRAPVRACWSAGPRRTWWTPSTPSRPAPVGFLVVVAGHPGGAVPLHRQRADPGQGGRAQPAHLTATFGAPCGGSRRATCSGWSGTSRSTDTLELTTPILLFASRSGCRWTTSCSCSPGSRRSTTAPATTPPPWPSGLEKTGRLVTSAAAAVRDRHGRLRHLGAQRLKLVGVGLGAGRRSWTPPWSAACWCPPSCGSPGRRTGGRPARCADPRPLGAS